MEECPSRNWICSRSPRSCGRAWRRCGAGRGERDPEFRSDPLPLAHQIRKDPAAGFRQVRLQLHTTHRPRRICIPAHPGRNSRSCEFQSHSPPTFSPIRMRAYLPISEVEPRGRMDTFLGWHLCSQSSRPQSAERYKTRTRQMSSPA